jgi:hypothetical protein
MTVRIYRSTDGSAPVLTGVAGSLVALFDACLVNGYGALAAAGWTKAFTAANKGAYKQNLTGSNNAAGMLLYVDDTGPGAGGAKEARATGFETMSAITPTGTGQFPTAGQSAVGVGAVVIRKSTTADATARAWTLIANGQTLYLFLESGDQASPLGSTSFAFGDFKSYKAGDQYAVWIMGRQTENQGGAQYDALQLLGGGNTLTLNNKYFGHYIARSWTALGGSVQCGKITDNAKIGTTQGGWASDAQLFTGTVQTFSFGRNNGTAQLSLPNGPDGALMLAPVYLFHGFSLRGYLPGLWCALQDRPFNHNDTVTIAAGTLAGKSLICQQVQACINNITTTETCQPLIEYSDTWT